MENKEENKFNYNDKIVKNINIKKININSNSGVNPNNNSNLKDIIFIRKNNIPLKVLKNKKVLFINNHNDFNNKNKNINLNINKKESFQNAGKMNNNIMNNINNSNISNDRKYRYHTKRNINIKNYKNFLERQKFKNINKIQTSNSLTNILKLDKSIDIIKNKTPNFNMQNRIYKRIYPNN